MMNKIQIDSNFDDFLAEDGLLPEVEAIAVKRILAFQIMQMMEAQNLSKSSKARRMKTSRAALERLLDPDNQSVTLNTLEKAAEALGRRLQILLV
jgi:DNA-binding Xre family transcriptional regulator